MGRGWVARCGRVAGASRVGREWVAGEVVGGSQVRSWPCFKSCMTGRGLVAESRWSALKHLICLVVFLVVVLPLPFLRQRVRVCVRACACARVHARVRGDARAKVMTHSC